MYEFDNFMLTYRLGDNGQRWISFRADYNPPIEGAVPTTPRSPVWFMFDEADFKRLIYSWDDAAGDGYHCVKKAGSELWMFFDLEIPRLPHVKKEIVVRTVEMPPRVAQIIYRLGRLVFRKLRRRRENEDWSLRPDEKVYELTMTRRVRWADAYGCGKGEVETIVDERARKLYESRLSDGDLFAKIADLKQIARNTTTTKWQTAQLRLSPDGERSLYFVVLDPRGNRSMNGAVINHGTPESPDWSVHT